MQLKQYIKENYGWVPFIFGAILVAKNLGGLPIPVDFISYGAFMLGAAYMISKNSFKPNLAALIFLMYLPLEILVAQPDPIFRSWPRLGLFALMFIVASPLVQGELAREFRYKTLRVVMDGCMIVGAISFFCYFLGINMMPTQSVEDMTLNLGGSFSGICNHSMTLGPIASYGAICGLYYYYTKRKRKYLLLFICCLGAMLFASSRAALLGCIAGLGSLLYQYSNNTGQFLKRVMMISFVAAATYPIWHGASAGLEQKQQNNIEMGGTFFSRNSIWEDRIEEFKSEPLVGIGFVSVDTSRSTSFSSSGVIEPGSSWLAILSMTGIIGFILFLNLYLPAVRSTRKSKREDSALFIGILAMLSVHMFAEGYVYSAGGFSCMFMWLALGCCYDMKFNLK